jgi:hypothetical protein
VATYPAYLTRSVLKNATPVPGATHAAVGVRPFKIVDPGGSGAEGQAGSMVTGHDISVTIYGNNIPALLALVGSAKEDVIVKYTTSAGALRKRTVKNVQIVEIVGQADIPRRDDGAPIAKLGVRGYTAWVSGGTLATMLLDAGDT